MQIKLKGKTQHGKNRINQHGEWWEVTDLSVRRGLYWLQSLDFTFRVKPLIKVKDSRSVSIVNDENFEIVEVRSAISEHVFEQDNYVKLRKMLGI